MYHSTSVVVGPDDRPTVDLNKGAKTFAAIHLGDLTVQLAGRTSHADQATWLRDLALKAESVAELLDVLDVSEEVVA